jgi:lauroyl/myristoyl acyltransferase
MQTIDLAKKAPELNAFLKKWIKVNPTEYMLYSTSKTQIHSPQFARLLNSIFDKQISTDMLRHMFFTNHFANRPMPSLEEMTSSATEAATSLPVMLQYIKKE